MTSFVFLARAAPARIVAAYLARTLGGDTSSNQCCATRLRCSVASCALRPIRLGRPALDHLPHDRGWWRRRLIALDADPEDVGDDRALDAVPELVEHLEGLVLVFDEWIALPVSAQAYALAEMLHPRQVLHPLPVDCLKHHVALNDRHQVGADLLHLPVVSLDRRLGQVFGHSLAALEHNFLRDL